MVKETELDRLNAQTKDWFNGKVPGYTFWTVSKPISLKPIVLIGMYVNFQLEANSIKTTSETDHFPIRSDKNYEKAVEMLCQLIF